MTEAEQALREVVEATVAATGGRSATTTIGPVPVTVQADTQQATDSVLAHALAGDPDPRWRPLTVVLATDASLPAARLPEPLRPSTDPGTTIVRAGALTAIVGDGMTWIVDDESGTAVRWAQCPGDIPVWEDGRPLRVALRWWSARHGAALLHAAAVAHKGKAVLLVGAGGAGKSTTAYACLGRGLDVLGDDYCIVEERPDGIVVHATYRLGNLTPASLDLLPWLRDRVVGIGHQGKAIVPLDSLPAGSQTADVRAVAAVTQVPGCPSRLVPASAFSVLRRLGPNSVAQVRGWNEQTLATCSAVVRGVPTWELQVGDVTSTAPVIRDHLVVA